MAEIDLLALRNKLTNGHDLTIAECDYLKSLIGIPVPSCPFCGAVPIIDWTVQQPNGEVGAMHISHAEKCYLALITGAQTHAGGSVEAWSRRYGG